jgi:hypothetical protein
MSNKLTSKTLDLLIEQVMNEEINLSTKDLNTFLQKKYIDDPNVSATGKSDLKTDVSVHKAVRDIAALRAPPPDELSDADLQYIEDNMDDPEIMNTEIMRQLIAIKYATKNADLKKRIIAILDKRDELIQLKSLDRQSFSQPQIRTVPAESGKYTGNIEPMLNMIFKNTPGIKARMKKVSEISTLFFTAAEGDKVSMQEIEALPATMFLAYVSLMDYFVEVTKSFDSGSGAYLFEWFLAMLSGGKVTGKESGPGGGMGAVDFEGKERERGSAKYYQKKSKIAQAATGFKVHEEVHYIIALKKQDRRSIGKTGSGTSDPSKMTMVDIYAPKVKKINETEFVINGKPVTIKTPTSKVPIGKHLGDLVDTIYIAQVPTKSFRDMVYKSVNSDLTSMKKELLKTFEGFFKQLENADISCRKYSVTGNVDNANATLTALATAGDQFDELVPQVNDGLEVRQENKTKSLKDLDKLIERVILKEMLKK